MYGQFGELQVVLNTDLRDADGILRGGGHLPDTVG
jgi:hypothetical protein